MFYSKDYIHSQRLALCSVLHSVWCVAETKIFIDNLSARPKALRLLFFKERCASRVLSSYRITLRQPLRCLLVALWLLLYHSFTVANWFQIIVSKLLIFLYAFPSFLRLMLIVFPVHVALLELFLFDTTHTSKTNSFIFLSIYIHIYSYLFCLTPS